MKESEFYKAAFSNRAFRHQKLQELRYTKSVEIGFLVMGGIGLVGHTLYSGLKDGSWDSGVGWLTILAISAAGYGVTVSRIAALEVFDGITNLSAGAAIGQAASNPGSPDSPAPLR